MDSLMAYWMITIRLNNVWIHLRRYIGLNIGTAWLIIIWPASVARSATRTTGDQEFERSIPAKSATVFYEDWSLNIFYGHSLPFADSRRAVVMSVSGERNANKYWLTIRGLSLSKLNALHITPTGWLGRKTSTQRKKNTIFIALQ